MSYDVRLEKYKKSLESAWGYNDYNDWPIKVNSVTHLFLKEFATEVLEDLNSIKDNPELIQKCIKEFGNPARLYRLIDPVIFGMKRLNYPVDYQRKVVLLLLDLIKQMKVGSEFNESGKNLIYNDSVIENDIKNKLIVTNELEAASIIQRFCGIMWAYTEAIFFRAHEVTKEIHGLYQLKDGNQLLVREYLHLQPYELWGDDMTFLKYKNIVVGAVYKPELKIRIDAYNHLFLENGNYRSDMCGYYILANGKPIEVDELNLLMEEALKTIDKIHSLTDKMDWRQLTNKYADIYWYRKSPFRAILGKETTVPDSVRKNIETGEPDKRRINNLSEEQIRNLIRIVI